ncbi:MAG: PspC domain-containing protein [Lachnospiraceae bacterium]
MEQKKLKKSGNNKMICGVCGGIGEYFNIDPTLIRLLWVILTIGGLGSGLLIYILAAIIMPQEI